jgi:DNA-binding LytR/AlgR family response regulator
MSKKKILIVEDEAIVAKDISVCLNRTGYEVLSTFSNGEQALEYLANNKPDLILMDIMLAGTMNGIETSAIVKEKFNIPVVFLTAYADEKTISKAKITDPYGYVIKPFKEIDLRTSIEMALYKFHKEQEKLSKGNREEENRHSIISQEYIYVKSNSKLVKVQNEQILFIEALKDYVILHTENAKYTIHSTMKDIEKKLPVEYFIRVHRSFIINLKKINSIDSSIVILENHKKSIPIGGSYKELLFKRLNLA